MTTEAEGVRARIALVDKYLETATSELQSATAEHWRHLRQHETYDLLRQRDRLVAQLEMVVEQEKKDNKR